jgi:hypothetical protein
MNALQDRPARVVGEAREVIALAPAPRRLPVGLLIRYALVMAIAGYLVFCHGCHGDEDNELFALLRR